MKDQLIQLLTQILKDMGIPGVVPEVEVPEDAVHGDYTTNVAMILAKTLKKSPMEIALSVKEAISRQLSVVRQGAPDQNIGKRGQKKSGKLSQQNILSAIDRIEVAPPGFLNIF